MKIVGIIVAYNPRNRSLEKCIESCISELDMLIVYRNSKICISEDYLNSNKIVVLGEEVNVGVARALNVGAKWAIANNYSHILLLDQDSWFECGHLAIMLTKIEHHRSNEKIGIFTPNIINNESLFYPESKDSKIVDESITSGSIIPVEVFSITGLFNEFLFIDCVDLEYCFRIGEKYGYKIIRYPNVYLHHELGYTRKTRYGFSTLDYSAFRTYYLVRNHLIVWKKHKSKYSKRQRNIVFYDYILLRAVKVILSEHNKFKKLQSIFRGFYHGITKSI